MEQQQKKSDASLTFLGSEGRLATAKTVILGCPYEDSGAFRHGAEMAPRAIRNFSQHIRSYHPQSSVDIGQLSFFDAGDMDVNGKAEAEVFAELEEKAMSFFLDERFLLALGGSRAVAYPLITAARKVWPHLKVISLDAHSGREERGITVSHDDLFTALIDDGVLREGDILHWGCRVGSRDALKKAGVEYFGIPPKVKKDALECLHRLYKHPVYVSIDMDVMDPPFAPGSGHPVYGGIGTAELLETLSLFQSLHVVGMDLTEIVPDYDSGGITAALGATVVKESLVRFCR